MRTKKDNRVLITYALCALALCEVINLNIVSVALPNLMGALGANIDDISLTMTSYMVSAAIFMPLSGMVINKFGMRRVVLISTLIFSVCTILCGTATNLNQMVIYRTIQGIGGAFFPAVSQAYIINNFTTEERPKMMSVLTTSLVVGPIIGPSFGGFLVQNVNWSWIFYVNLPLLTFAFVVVTLFMPETELIPIKIDYTSFTFLAIGVGCLELFIDQGNTYMWFQSLPMTIIFGIAIVFLFYFFWRAFRGQSVINFAVFKDKNFNLCCIYLFVFYLVANAFMTYLPDVLQTVWGYQVDSTGYLLVPRGIFAVIFAPLIVKYAPNINSKFFLITSCLACAACTAIFCFINTSPDLVRLFISEILIAYSIIAFISIIYTTAYLKMPKELSNDASGVFNFFRTFAGSVGTSITATLVTIFSQVSWHDMARNINKYRHSLHFLIPQVGHRMSPSKLLTISSWEIAKQANLLAFIGVFVIFTFAALALCIVPFFIESLPRGGKIEMGE